MLYLAIDQHSKQLTVNLRDEAGDVRLRRQVSTKRMGMEEFGQQLAAYGEPYVAIVEVCGFNDWLLQWLPQHGCQEIVLVQPDRRSKKKTDHRDANALGELLWINRQRLLGGQRVQGLRRVQISSARDQADRQLTALRHVAACRKTRCTTASIICCGDTTSSRIVPPKACTRSRPANGCGSCRFPSWIDWS